KPYFYYNLFTVQYLSKRKNFKIFCITSFGVRGIFPLFHQPIKSALTDIHFPHRLCSGNQAFSIFVQNGLQGCSVDGFASLILSCLFFNGDAFPLSCMCQEKVAIKNAIILEAQFGLALNWASIAQGGRMSSIQGRVLLPSIRVSAKSFSVAMYRLSF